MKRNIEPATESGESGAPIELRVLALLELKKRQLVRELAEVLEEYQQLSREIESKRIPIPLRFGGCSREELDSMQGGKLFVEWRNQPEEESVAPRTTD
jgi:hypothetical protein